MKKNDNNHRETLALFDFDGTLTTHDSFTKFIVTYTSKTRLIIGFVLLLPLIVLYKLKIISGNHIRPFMVYIAFWRRNSSHVRAQARQYAKNHLPTILRTEAMEKFMWHINSKHRVIVISASLEPYLSVWCAQHGVELICSELETLNNRCTGKYLKGDCTCDNKVIFIKQRVNLSEYTKIYAYGDTLEDYPMLALAHIATYQGKLYTHNKSWNRK